VGQDEMDVTFQQPINHMLGRPSVLPDIVIIDSFKGDASICIPIVFVNIRLRLPKWFDLHSTFAAFMYSDQKFPIRFRKDRPHWHIQFRFQHMLIQRSIGTGILYIPLSFSVFVRASRIRSGLRGTNSHQVTHVFKNILEHTEKQTKEYFVVNKKQLKQSQRGNRMTCMAIC
jgi:hypothetical protein